MNIRTNAETNDEQISELSKVMLRLVYYEQQRHRNGTHTHTHIEHCARAVGLLAQNPNPHCQIFTSVSVDSSLRHRPTKICLENEDIGVGGRSRKSSKVIWGDHFSEVTFKGGIG